MTKLPDYVSAHTTRGECQCGKCCDRGAAPDPTGHSVDTTFFKVAATKDADQNSPTKAMFLGLTKAHHGEFAECDPLDGNEHGYIELGAWIGDQGLALQYMALGALLGVFRLMSPDTMMPSMPTDLKMRMAESGLVTVKSL